MCTRASGRNACANCAEVEELLRQFKVPDGNRVERLERQMGDWMARVNIIQYDGWSVGIGACFHDWDRMLCWI
jgi:hypothetical protein